MLLTAPSVEPNDGAPQLSLADAVPRAAFIAAVDGLQPRDVVVPVVVITGAVWSNVQVTVLDAVAVLPQPSVDDQLLV